MSGRKRIKRTRVWDENRERWTSSDARRVKPIDRWENGFLYMDCPPGYHLVRDHFRNMPHQSSMATEIDGVYIGDYCAKNPRRRR